jgi:hypothetical protein
MAARGGAIHHGQPTVVGEQAPELVLPTYAPHNNVASVASMYAPDPSDRTVGRPVTLADAMSGIEQLKKRLMQLEGRHG